jgi:hypothetical protein
VARPAGFAAHASSSGQKRSASGRSGAPRMRGLNARPPAALQSAKHRSRAQLREALRETPSCARRCARRAAVAG